MDVRFTATSLVFFLLVLAASVAAPLEVPAAVQEFHEAMTKNPYNETAVVAEGVIGAEDAGLNVTTNEDGDIHVDFGNATLSTSTLIIIIVVGLIAIECCVLLLIFCTWFMCKCKKRAENDEERPKRAVGLTPDNEGREHDVVVEVPDTNDM